ncbi:MAG: type II toxin-antitoxin system death-on-curing family toxin [Bacteroidetes bacterium]|nr:type II toxin-antitoxin system death-on-curing family toxin [Bacteroidota bacterium]
MKKYLTKDEIVVIHKNLIDEFGGLHGIRDNNSLESAVMRPQSGYYKDIYEEASALMESLASNHSFVDGNKRISFFATDVFLRMNGHYIDCETEDAYKFYIENLENNSFRFRNILNWLKENSRSLK